MRWLLVVILMVSLGLNLGLAWRLARTEDPPEPRDRSGRFGPGHAMHDSTRWRGFLERRLERMRVELELDEEQVAAFRALHEGAQGLGRQFRAIESGRRDVFRGIADGTRDADEVRRTLAELSRRQRSVDSLIVEKLLQELEILTPEQRPRYLEMLPGERFGGPGEHGPGTRGGKDGHGRRHGRRGGG
jgi:Spy/CpxP family protein refolding chaperone